MKFKENHFQILHTEVLLNQRWVRSRIKLGDLLNDFSSRIMDTRTCEKCEKYDETSELRQSDQVLCDSCYEKTHQAKEHQASFEENINTAMLDTQIDVHDDDGDDKDGDNDASDSDLTVTNPNDPPSTVVVKLTNSEEAEKCAKCPRNVLNGFRCARCKKVWHEKCAGVTKGQHQG